VLNDRLANDVRRNGTHSSGTANVSWNIGCFWNTFQFNWKCGSCV